MRAARRRPALKAFTLSVFIIVILVATPQAQQPAAYSSGAPGAITAGPAAVAPDATAIDLLVGRSTILNVGSAISRVSLTVPDIADAMVTTPQQLLIHGKTPGTISLFVWDKAGGIKTYEVTVRRDLTRLVEQVKQLFPGEPITVTGSGKEVVLSGTVSTKYVVDKAAEVATGYVEKKEDVVNLLKQQEGVASNQVLLRVRFAEVSRSALQELGASFILDQFKNDWFGRSTTQQFAAPDFDSDKPNQLNFSDFLNLFVFNSKHGVGAVVRALQSKGLFQSLAEPNLISLNGKEASFLAGGEYPYPVAQPSSGGGTAITVQFKEFGIRLNFTPTVLANNLIDLKVRPEVSSLDFTNAIVLNGFRLPALSTRRTETEVELEDGQTFAVAGLLNNTLNNSMQKIPGIGDIPILGYLFRSRAYQKNQTELVVMITPTIVRRGSTGVSEGLPSLVEPYLNPPAKTYPNDPPYTGSPRFPVTEKGGSNQAQKSGDEPKPATAPAAQHPAMPVVKPATNPPAAPVRQPAATQHQQPAPTSPSTKTSPQPAMGSSAGGGTQPHTVSQASATHSSAAPAQPAVTKPLTREQQKRIDEAREAEKRQAAEKAEAARKAAEVKAEADRKAAEEKAEADRKAAEEKAEADRKAAEEQKKAEADAAREKERQQKLDEERAKREALVAKKNAEAERKKQDEQKKHEKALADAAERLRQAQAAYEAEMAKAKGPGGGGQD